MDTCNVNAHIYIYIYTCALVHLLTYAQQMSPYAYKYENFHMFLHICMYFCPYVHLYVNMHTNVHMFD